MLASVAACVALASGLALGRLSAKIRPSALRRSEALPELPGEASTVRSKTVHTGETKSEIRARLDELRLLTDKWERDIGHRTSRYVEDRRAALDAQLEAAAEDLFRSVIRSHEAVCAAKQMDERAAYGQDPAMYYTLAICGEAGEMGNKIVKALRNGNDPTAAREAVISELPDVFIYGAVLARVLDIDLTRLVNEKVGVVIQRAESGYYGGPLPKVPAGGAP